MTPEMNKEQRGAALVELAITMVMLLTLAIGVSEFGRGLLQLMNLSMINLEGALLAGSLNLVPGTNVGSGHVAIEEQSQNLLGLSGQNSGLGPNPPLAVTSVFTRIQTATLPPSSVAIDLASHTTSIFNSSAFVGGLGLDLTTRYVAPNFLGPPISVTPGFENPNPIVDCDGLEIPGCTSHSCAPFSCPP